jgi:hypothetical protein
MSRRAVQLLLSLPEKLRFIQGLRAWLGLSTKPFPISRPARAGGDPQDSLAKLINLASAGPHLVFYQAIEDWLYLWQFSMPRLG